jgi:uncharacterized protein with HEPN domain
VRSSLDAFRSSAADLRAASYSILVISEAVRRLPDDPLKQFSDVPWHAIRAIGNKLRHEYHRVSDVIIWGIVSEHAGELKTVIEAMLRDLPEAR